MKGEDRMERFFKDLKTAERMQEGPWGSHIVSYATQLHVEGYTRQYGQLQIRLIAGFSRWVRQKAIADESVTVQHVAEYLRYRKRCGYGLRRGDAATLTRFLELLRNGDAIVQHRTPAVTTPVECLLEKFDVYLQSERALAPTTRLYYGLFARQFLNARFGSGPVELGSVCAADITGFVQRQAAKLGSKRSQMMTTALRSFLRFARYRGDITLDLAACVPTVASWSFSTLPKSLPAVHVEQVLASCNRQTAVGQRDYAILMLLARLGLRAGEIVRLSLEDIDWENGYITVQGKTGRSSQLPLPADVGQAIADYLKDARPRVSSNRSVFLRSQAPIRSLTNLSTVSTVVRRALARAGIDSPRKGAHQFRHTLATEMLKQGASLREIGDLLRHQNPNTTTIYAKVDLVALRTLALPWPGGVR